jgi:hypothetical protein
MEGDATEIEDIRTSLYGCTNQQNTLAAWEGMPPKLEDIGVVATVSDNDSEEEITLHNVRRTPFIDTHKTCLQCKAHVEPPLGRCSKPDCKMLQRFDLW